MKSAVLVTGGAGFIGSHAAKRLRDEGHKVVVLDNLSTGEKRFVPKGVVCVQGNVGDALLVRELIVRHNIKSVMHFAAFIQVGESMQPGGRRKYYANNALQAKVFMETVSKAGVENFIFSSTAAVYGNPDILPVPESAPLAPVNNYGLSKVLAERHLDRISRITGMRKAILRYFNVAGADPERECGYRLDVTPTHLIRVALEVARGKRDHLEIYGTDYPTPDNTCIRDYIHISDLITAHMQALWHLEAGGIDYTLNVGYGGKGHSVLDVHAAVQRVTGKKIILRQGERRPGDPPLLVADTSRIRAAFRWEPQYEGDDGLDRIVKDQWEWELSQEPALT